MSRVTLDEVNERIEAVWRIEAARLISGLARLLGDLGTAEEVAQDALLAAMEQWPVEGIPRNPGAWLMTTGKRRAIDRIRREVTLRDKLKIIGAELDDHEDPYGAVDDRLDDQIGDDLLRLIFTACHPVLGPDARVALTLKVVGGLSTAEIARAFLSTETTIAQRIVRAKKTLASKEIGFEAPTADQLPDRLPTVLSVIYLIFNEGYAASAGDDWMRPELCITGQRLGRMLYGLLPTEPEVFALTSLMELQASRLHARTDHDGNPVLLLDQQRSRWDRLLIVRGLQALDECHRLGGARGSYALQAAIAACHARALTAEDTDWTMIAAIYETLAEVSPSPVVELNRAVALGMAYGPAAGLQLVDQLRDLPAMERYHLLHSVRGDLLAKLDRGDEAAEEFRRAAELVGNEQERALMINRACATASTAR
ncbi:RNA polymerase sigma factor [Microlunatus elymi]|uniref:RNA polymerase sigma factor n=1 Tax=Microlunatus elymi TaxID=2596828 RepID=UPI002B1BD076|nr:RNA polymerase sigma factor [Microlunatus elymi]